MKFTFKLFCSMLTGVLSGYCMPYLLMFAMNISKGNGVNSDGEMFQLPAIILIVIAISFTNLNHFLTLLELWDLILCEIHIIFKRASPAVAITSFSLCPI